MPWDNGQASRLDHDDYADNLYCEGVDMSEKKPSPTDNEVIMVIAFLAFCCMSMYILLLFVERTIRVISGQ